MANETSEIYRMNKLLEIEQADWERQLKQAVSVPHGFNSPLAFPAPTPSPLFLIIDSIPPSFRALRIPQSAFSKPAAYYTNTRGELGGWLQERSSIRVL